jgi:hypothetical protein
MYVTDGMNFTISDHIYIYIYIYITNEINPSENYIYMHVTDGMNRW